MKPAIAKSRQPQAYSTDAGTPQVVHLSNGRYRVRLSSVGSGFSELDGIAITRWTPDRVCDAHGFFLYLRDLNDYAAWSIGYQPMRSAPDAYEFSCRDGVATVRREEHGIRAQLDVAVALGKNFEIRRCTLTNLGQQPRRIELTSYVEWVLTSAEADRNHPAFSKLFVETQFCSKRSAIIARRRPRRNDEAEVYAFQSLLSDCANFQDELEFDTNRLRFIGRGHTLAAPQSLEPGCVLTADTGPVLDPIASLRTIVLLAPGETKEVAFILGAAIARSDIDQMMESVVDLSRVQRVFDEASAAANPQTIGIPATSDMKASDVARAGTYAKRRTNSFAAKRLASTPAERNGDVAKQKAPLAFENGYGGFSSNGREYIIRLAPDSHGSLRHPPMPWTNVICNEQAGFVVTERGAGYTWAGNSRLNRLSAWHNDPVIDPHGEAIWIRDDDAGEFWSPTPGPTPAIGVYQVRHGFGYSVFEHESHELAQEVTMFMVPRDPVKVARLRVRNLSGRTRRLSLYSFVHWALGGLAAETVEHVTTEHDGAIDAILAHNPHRELYSGAVAFSAIAAGRDTPYDLKSHTCNRVAFLGPNGDVDAPVAIEDGHELDDQDGGGLDPCAAWQLSVEILPGAGFECSFLLGEAANRDTAAELIASYRKPARISAALEVARKFWTDTTSAITVETPDREIDLMVNGWLVYQNLSCRMWARSAFYQPGGAFGFRDQLQDSAAFALVRPDLTRAQIVRHAGQQFVEGDVLHWWHPDTGYGVRTRFSDDLLWLPMVVAEYVRTTGDAELLDEQANFIVAPPLAPGQQEAYLRPERSSESGDIYEHCCRALDRGLTAGSHGLPLIGCGDWNDGFSGVGRHGKGESVWLGFFIDYILQRMLPICASRGDQERIDRYTGYREQLAKALETAGWDGSWYRRAYYDNGQPIGSSASDECKIDALVQAWAVISGAAGAERVQLAIRALEVNLVDDEAGMIRLLTPPFNRTPNEPGYIKGYLPGIRENGGQYTHGVLWVVRALAELGRGTRAVELLRKLTPVWHSRSKHQADIYKTEPYVVAADIYGEPPHVGRGGWTWYTGSAGWMFRVAVESIFGLSIEGGRTLVVSPSISSNWPTCRLTYRRPGGETRYEIVIDNPRAKEHGVSSAMIDGEPVSIENGAARIPLSDDGKFHRVVVRL